MACTTVRDLSTSGNNAVWMVRDAVKSRPTHGQRSQAYVRIRFILVVQVVRLARPLVARLLDRHSRHADLETPTTHPPDGASRARFGAVMSAAMTLGLAPRMERRV